IIPAALAHRDELLANPEGLEQIVAKFTAKDVTEPVAVAATDPAIPFNPSLKDWQREIDPEFQGNQTAWVDKYGHVPTLTAEKRATEQFSAWVSHVRALSKRWQELPEL